MFSRTRASRAPRARGNPGVMSPLDLIRRAPQPCVGRINMCPRTHAAVAPRALPTSPVTTRVEKKRRATQRCAHWMSTYPPTHAPLVPRAMETQRMMAPLVVTRRATVTCAPLMSTCPLTHARRASVGRQTPPATTRVDQTPRARALPPQPRAKTGATALSTASTAALLGGPRGWERAHAHAT